jgi:hypothetical protein
MKGRQTPCFARTLVSHNDSRVIAMRKNKKNKTPEKRTTFAREKKALRLRFIHSRSRHSLRHRVKHHARQRRAIHLIALETEKKKKRNSLLDRKQRLTMKRPIVLKKEKAESCAYASSPRSHKFLQSYPEGHNAARQETGAGFRLPS